MAVDLGDEQLRYYLAELAYLRGAGAAFGRRHPKVARRLELGHDGSADPQIERLIESFAFLTGRLQRNFDAEFPAIPAALLGVLYPHLVAPVPSCAIARFEPDPEQSRALMGVDVPAGTPLFALAADGLTCRFRTSTPVTLWPIEVTGAELRSPAQYAFLDDHPQVATVLRLGLGCLGNRSFAEFTPPSLRFFLHAGPRMAPLLYTLLLDRTIEIAVLPEGATAPTARLRPDRVRPVGFAPDEAVLPHPAHAHQGYRLLQEHGCFPEKFLFVDIDGLTGFGDGRRVDLLFLLNERPAGSLHLDRRSFRLGCAPMVNLFRHTSEPIRLDQLQSEYRLVPDNRWERSVEIHSILKVSTTSAGGDDGKTVQPFYSFDHAAAQSDAQAFWNSRRQASERPDLPGTDVFLGFKDLAFRPTKPASQVVFAQTLCTNRGLAEQLPPGAPLQIELDAPVRTITCLTRPTPQLAPPVGGETLWRLVSHLSLNHLSLAGSPDGLAALKEILRLHGGRDVGEREHQLAGLHALSTRRVVRHVGADAWRGFVRGTEVTLTIDEDQLDTGTAFLLASVLRHFLGLYAGVNSFTGLVLASRQRQGTWKTWPPLVGDAALL